MSDKPWNQIITEMEEACEKLAIAYQEKITMNPEWFAKEVATIHQMYGQHRDKERYHIELDALKDRVLIAQGYEDGVTMGSTIETWCA